MSAKRQRSTITSSENVAKAAALLPQVANEQPALANVINQRNDPQNGSSSTNLDMGIFCKRDILAKMVDGDKKLMDPKVAATGASYMYLHLRAFEVKNRPSPYFMEKVQTDITSRMRAILVDWLVQVAEEYSLGPDTLYLTVNYIDRYLSGNNLNMARLQLLGVACMMIAFNQVEICPRQVEEFCNLTDNAFFKDEVLEMESDVMKFLKFEMEPPTIKTFLRRFIVPAQGIRMSPTWELEDTANYLAELSLLEYSMLQYTPSLIAASVTFLTMFILSPNRKPWNCTMRRHTLYKPSDLCECVKALHRICCTSHESSLTAIREKYTRDKYNSVAKFSCPPAIPQQYFLDEISW